MQNKKQKSQEEEDIVRQFQSLLYPSYPLGCSSTQFLSHYESLFLQLRKLDLASYDQIKKIQLPARYSNAYNDIVDQNERIVFFVIEQLNNLCTYCHRKELHLIIMEEVGKYTRNLKQLAIGKKPINVSLWQNDLKNQSKLEELSQERQQQILKIFDRLYQDYQRIPNYYLVLLAKPQTLISLHNLESKLIVDSISDKTSMPISHKYYLGIIASSTYGCRYLWNLMVNNFIKVGGDIEWIQEGIESAPQYLKKFSTISYQMAYNFKLNILEGVCGQLGFTIEDTKILEGLYILSYYHFLASLSIVLGLVPESTQNQKYLPHVPYLQPSPESFEIMKKASKKQLPYQKLVAKQFSQMYSWEKKNDQQLQNMRNKSRYEKSKSGNKKDFQKIYKKVHLNGQRKNSDTLSIHDSSENEYIVALQQEEIMAKIKNSHTMKNIQNVYEKYVPFDERMSCVQFKTKKKSRNSNVQEGNTESFNDSEAEYDFIYFSEWNFEESTGNFIESVRDSSFFKSLKELLRSLRFLNKEKSKKLKTYYESLQNYMYQYVSYEDLMNGGLSVEQQNYIKLLTRSPFLYNKKSFLKMKEDLQKRCGLSNALQFCLQIFGFKLELSICLTTYVYSRYIESQE